MLIPLIASNKPMILLLNLEKPEKIQRIFSITERANHIFQQQA